MQAFFPDLDIVRLPPESVRLLDLTAEPLSDGLRIRTHLGLTPFLKPPVIELVLLNPAGETCGGASIVEPLGWNLDLTLHIRTRQPAAGQYELTAVLSYPGLDEIDRRKVEFTLPLENHP